MIPACVSAMHATMVVKMDYATTGALLSVCLTPDTLLNAVAILDKEGYLLEDVTATDLTEAIELTYHFSLLQGSSRLILRLLLPHKEPSAPSISSIYPGADWHERECYEFFGIHFSGHPNLHNLLLPEDFTGHPLLKEKIARKSLTEVLPRPWLDAAGLEDIEALPSGSAKVQQAVAAQERS